MNELTYNQLPEALLRVVTSLRAAWEEERQQWLPDEPGPHIVFGDLLAPHLSDLLRRQDETEARRIFSFLEELATADLQSIRDVVAASVLESLLGDALLRDRALPLMGPATRRMARAILQPS